MACIVMATVMACIVMATVMAYIGMARIVMDSNRDECRHAYTHAGAQMLPAASPAAPAHPRPENVGMAYIGMALYSYGLYSHGLYWYGRLLQRTPDLRT